MARREIPEINAGSMADIAFLLLIFFLVTTTMDKDQAYLRDIPKKVVVPIPPAPVEERNICEVRANDRNELMVRGDIMNNPDDISERIIEWYTKNEKSNDVTNNFPMYTHLTSNEIAAALAKAESELDAVADNPNADEAMIQYHETIVDEWAGRKQALALLGKSSLPEIYGQAHVRVSVQKGTHYELFAKIQSEIEEAIYELRDKASMDIFNESYGVIRRRYSSDKNGEDKAKLDLLKILYPDRIIEVTPKR
jgi:biopolymer transport protein ExbD